MGHSEWPVERNVPISTKYLKSSCLMSEPPWENSVIQRPLIMDNMHKFAVQCKDFPF